MREQDLHTYKLPVELAAALATERVEFVGMYANKMIAAGDTEKAEMARLIGDLLEDRRRARARVAEISATVSSMEGSVRKVQEVAAAAARSIKGEPEEAEE